MAKYKVTIARVVNYVFEYEIDADSEKQVRSMAWDMHHKNNEDGRPVHAEEFINTVEYDRENKE